MTGGRFDRRGVWCVIAGLSLWLVAMMISHHGSSSAEAGASNQTEESSPADQTNPMSTATKPVQLDKLAANLTIFLLAIFVGFEVITKVPPTLHTPLMSGSNAISGITIVGALAIAGVGAATAEGWIGFFAVALATINVVGGFLVTHRMLMMFKKK